MSPGLAPGWPDQLPRFAPANSPFVPTATTPPSVALAGRPNPFYASSYRNFYSLVVSHKWTDKLTEVGETDHVYDPKIIGFSENGKPSSIYYAGLVHWFLYDFNEKLSGGWRSEVFWDPYGAATGSRSTFYEMSLSADAGCSSPGSGSAPRPVTTGLSSPIRSATERVPAS